MEPGSTRILVRAKDQRAAIRGAFRRMDRGGTIEVVDAEGRSVATVEVPSGPQGPWWYLRPSPVWWFLAATMLLQPTIRLIGGDTSGVLWWMSLLFGPAGLLVVLAVIASRRRDTRLASAAEVRR